MALTRNNYAGVKGDISTPIWAGQKGSVPSKIINFIQTYCIIPKGYGAGLPMVLAPFQQDAIEELFADGIRTGEFSLGRGNGKSSLIAGIALAHLCIEEFSPQVPLIATTLKQIETATYNIAVQMALKSPAIKAKVHPYNARGDKRLRSFWNDGTMFPMASDVDGLQGLDPSLAIIDEVGFVTVESWEAIKLASGKRPDSLVLGLGTTGLRDSALYHLHQLHEQAVNMPTHCRINYSADPYCDIHDPEQHRKANPAIDAGFLDASVIANDARTTSETLFRAFRLNQWVDLARPDSWLGEDAADVWRELADAGYQWDASKPCYAGVDVSLRHDTTAVVAIQQRDDGRWHAVAYIFRADGRAVDQTEVMECIRRIPNLKGCAYDPRFFELAAQMLANEGIPMHEIAQSPQNMVPAVGNLYRAITNNKITHDGSPDFAAQIINAQARTSEGGFTLSKMRNDLKIDSAVALALAYTLTTEAPTTDFATVRF